MKIFKVVILLFFTCTIGNLYPQVTESGWSTIIINNKVQKQILYTDSLPPVLSMISPQVRENETFKTSSEKLTVIGKATDNNGISALLINSMDVITNPSGIFSEDIILKEGINTLCIVAMDLERNVTEKEITVEYLPYEVFTETIEIEGDYYALLIAVNEYQSPDLFPLDNPVRDVRSLKKVLLDKYTFRDENILCVENPTKEDILIAFDRLSRGLTKDDNLLVFYAGHGWWDPDANIGFWLPSDADNVSRTKWVRNSTVQDFMKELKVKHTLLITDACFSGSIFVSRSLNIGTSVAIKKLYDLPSRKAMTSGSITPVPDESIFVKYFIDRLIKNKEKYLSSGQLFNSFRIAVINNSTVLPQYGVIKNVGDEGGEFIFIMR